MLTKQAWMDRKPSVKRIEVPSMGDFTYIKKMTGAERAALLAGTVTVDGKAVAFNQDAFVTTMSRTVQIALCDESGVRLFNDSEDDFNLVNSMDGDVLDLLFEAITAFNSIGAAEETEALKN